MDSFDVVVVGGGISGLGAAHYLAAAGLKTVVLEKDERPGGVLHSAVLHESFWVEMGAHTAYNSYGRLLDILEKTGLALNLMPRTKVPWKIWENGKSVSIPSRLKIPELLVSLPRIFFKSRSKLSVREYYSAILGQANYRDTVGPMLTAVTSQDPGDFPADMLFRKRPRRKDVIRSFTLPRGLGQAAETLAGSGAFQVRTGAEVVQAARTEQGYQISLKGGGKLQARGLMLACLPSVSARLLEPFSQGVAGLLAGINEHAFFSLGVALHNGACPLESVAGLVAPDEPFYSVVTRDILPHRLYRGFVFHFRPGVDKAEALQQAEKVLGVGPADWLGQAVRNTILPSPGAGHRQLVADLDKALQGETVGLTGNYFQGMAIEDCLGRSEQEAQRLAGLLAG
ncbi:MAG: FAD-dependent oxidoreductase [Deltaproteobacteria bacterium]|nr:FAD-dependent oxidoreductase [Deltaproteobacteria bacterium]